MSSTAQYSLQPGVPCRSRRISWNQEQGRSSTRGFSSSVIVVVRLSSSAWVKRSVLDPQNQVYSEHSDLVGVPLVADVW